MTVDDKDKLLKLVSQRSVLIKHLYELIEFEQDKDKFLANLKQNPKLNSKSKWISESFRFEVDTYNFKIKSLKDKVNKIEELDFLSLRGEINLKNPTNVFYLIECYASGKDKSKAVRFYFARYLLDGNRKLLNELDLSKRKFISNTSMDVTLSCIMANLAKVKENDIVLDCFVGSGSNLIAIAKFGGFCFGTDIDYKLLHALSKSSKYGVKQREKDESIKSNFKQYNVENKYLDVIIADTSLPLWKTRFN